MEFIQTYVEKIVDTKTNTVTTAISLKLNAKDIRDGKILRQITGNELKVLLALSSFMNIEGQCYPTQRQLATLTGISLRATNTLIASLVAKEILSREFVGANGNSLYTLDFNSHTVISLFCSKYLEIYKVKYNVNGAKESSLIQNKLLPNFTEEQIKNIIPVIIEEYATRWKSAQYPTPTIGMMCLWGANAAIEIYSSRKPRIPDPVETEDSDELPFF